MHVGEFEAREPSACEGFPWKCWKGELFCSTGSGGRSTEVREESEGGKGVEGRRDKLLMERERVGECNFEEILPLCLDCFQHWGQ